MSEEEMLRFVSLFVEVMYEKDVIWAGVSSINHVYLLWTMQSTP